MTNPKLRVSPALALAMLKDWEELDEWGRRKWSVAKLADRYGVGETTAYRVIHKQGAYQNLSRLAVTPEQVNERAQESFARLLGLPGMAEIAHYEGVETPKGPDVPPPPPLDELEDPTLPGLAVRELVKPT